MLLFPEGGWLVDSALEDLDQEEPCGGEESGEERPDSPEPNRAHHLSVLRSIYIPQVNIIHTAYVFLSILKVDK